MLASIVDFSGSAIASSSGKGFIPMQVRRGKVVALLIALTVMLYSVPGFESAANAAFPCTWAPGEVQVGEDRGTPLCEQRGPPAPPPPPMVWVENHFALAAHPDAADMWVAIGYPNGEAASNAALSACAQDMGTGCLFMIKSYNSSYVIAIGSTGQVYTNWDSTVAKARKIVMADCKKAGDVCVETSNGTAKPGRKVAGSSFQYRPEIWRPKGNFRHVFSSAAWIEPVVAGSSNDVWIATGYHNAKEAEQAAVNQCTRDSGFKCAPARTVASAFLYVAHYGAGEARVGSSPTEKLAKTIMQTNCGKKTKCTLAAVYSPWKTGVVRHHVPAAGP